MYRGKDNKLLKTKIIATLGNFKSNVYDPLGKYEKKLTGDDKSRDYFMKGFFDNSDYLLDVLRLNMSFFEPPQNRHQLLQTNEYKIIQWLSNNRNKLKNVALMGDLPGPKLRLRCDQELKLSAGQQVELKLKGTQGNRICVYGKTISEEIHDIVRKLKEYREKEAHPIISIGDGMAILKIEDFTEDSIMCIADKDGILKDKKGVSFKGLLLDLRTFKEDDEKAVDFLIENAIDWNENPWDPNSLGSFLAFIAVSFVRSAEDIERAKIYIENKMLEKIEKSLKNLPELKGKDLRQVARILSPSIIAKIETKDATEDIDRILDIADGAMVARGDLALQIGPHNVPGFQKRLIRICNLRGKPVITATQMLKSMVSYPEPSRAEATDVFNAILDGSDAVMLTDETAFGKFPYQAVKTMIEIARAAEKLLDEFGQYEKIDARERRRLIERRFRDLLLGSETEIEKTKKRMVDAMTRAQGKQDNWLVEVYQKKFSYCVSQSITDRISLAASILASSSDEYCAIVAPSTTGRTVRMISRLRQEVMVLGSAHDTINRKKLVISYGVYPINCGMTCSKTGNIYDDPEEVFCDCITALKNENYLKTGDLIVWTAGTPLFVPGTTNLIKIRKVD